VQRGESPLREWECGGLALHAFKPLAPQGARLYFRILSGIK